VYAFLFYIFSWCIILHASRRSPASRSLYGITYSHLFPRNIVLGSFHHVGDQVSYQHKAISKVTMLHTWNRCRHSDRLFSCYCRGFECYLGHRHVFLSFMMCHIGGGVAASWCSNQGCCQVFVTGTGPHWSVAPYRQIYGFYARTGKYDCELDGGHLSTRWQFLSKLVNVTVICWSRSLIHGICHVFSC
jgi:hypothetical protein